MTIINNRSFSKVLYRIQLPVVLLCIASIASSCKTKSSAIQELMLSHQAELIIDDKFDFTPFAEQDFKIIKHQIKSTSLKLFIEVNNACGAKHFRLITTSALMKSLPPQKSVFLINDNLTKVNCNRKAEVELEFDLSVLKSVPYETIVLNFDGYDSPVVYQNKTIQK